MLTATMLGAIGTLAYVAYIVAAGGSHTATGVPDPEHNRLLVYNSAYGAANVTSLDGWKLARTKTGMALHNANGELFATADLRLDLQWVSGATAQRWVVVLHGIRLGVRTPLDMSPAQYTAEARRAEVTESRKMGLVTGGLVRWHG